MYHAGDGVGANQREAEGEDAQFSARGGLKMRQHIYFMRERWVYSASLEIVIGEKSEWS